MKWFIAILGAIITILLYKINYYLLLPFGLILISLIYFKHTGVKE